MTPSHLPIRQVRQSLTEVVRIAVPLLILTGGVGGFWALGKRPQPERNEAAANPPLVRTEPIRSFPGPLQLEVDGIAVPYRQVTVSAEVAGRIVRRESAAHAGGLVHEGDFLLEVDPADYALELTRIESELKKSHEDFRSVDVDIANTEAMIALADEELQLRQRELERRRNLPGTAISESEVDRALRLELSSRNSRQAHLNQLAALRQRQATLEATRTLVEIQRQRARLDLDRTRVRAPLTGTVVRHYVEEGDFVAKGDPLFLLNGSRHMEVKCSLRVDQLYWLWLEAGLLADGRPADELVFQVPQTKAEVAFDFEGQQHRWSGVLTRFEGSGLDPDTRLIPCRVRVDQPTQVTTSQRPEGATRYAIPALFSGMYVTVRIPVQPRVSLLSVPRQAIRPHEQLWVVRDGRLVIAQVDVAQHQSDYAIVRPRDEDRLRAGDQVVTSPLSHPHPGMEVTQAGKQ